MLFCLNEEQCLSVVIKANSTTAHMLISLITPASLFLLVFQEVSVQLIVFVSDSILWKPLNFKTGTGHLPVLGFGYLGKQSFRNEICESEQIWNPLKKK